MYNLKPCPFCGGPAMIFDFRAQVRCLYCGNGTKEYYDSIKFCGKADTESITQAVNAWNRRVDKS